MKKIYLIFTFFILLSNCFAQFYNVGDTTEVELITFESESIFFQQGTPTTNIWQIGQPSKLTFTEAYSAPNAIVTDTLNSYPANNHSWFDLKIPTWDFLPYIGISFNHKINTDTLADGGYIAISYNQGLTWYNIIEDTSYNFATSPAFGDDFHTTTTGLYSETDILYNGEKGFSGTINGWEKVQFNWVMAIPVKKDDWPDTLLLRFNFISDATENAKDGWMIDNIRLFWVDIGGSIHEKPLVSNLEIYPNPMIENANIKTKNNNKIELLQVFSLSGQLVFEEYVNDNKYSLHKDNLNKGVYFVKCIYPNHKSETIKMVVE